MTERAPGEIDVDRIGEDVPLLEGDPHRPGDPATSPRSRAARTDPQGLRSRHLRAERRQPPAMDLRRRHRARAPRLHRRAVPEGLPRLHRAGVREGRGRSRLPGRAPAQHARLRCIWPSISTRRPCICSSPAGRAAASRRPRRSSPASRTSCSPAARSDSARRSPPCTSAYGREIDAYIGLSEKTPSCALIPIGWPLGKYGRPPRESVDRKLYFEVGPGDAL